MSQSIVGNSMWLMSATAVACFVMTACPSLSINQLHLRTPTTAIKALRRQPHQQSGRRFGFFSLLCSSAPRQSTSSNYHDDSYKISTPPPRSPLHVCRSREYVSPSPPQPPPIRPGPFSPTTLFGKGRRRRKKSKSKEKQELTPGLSPPFFSFE